MKTVRSVTVPTSKSGSRAAATSATATSHPHDSCGCGCSCDCEETCCELECNVRPRFFCGQVLTNQDLDAMISWAGRRFGLSRYRDGWGVVCGLDVTCHRDSPTTVGVGPGYAVDCCGRDVVVCEPASIDLAAVCADPEEPCSDLGINFRKLKEGEEPRRVKIDLAIRHTEVGVDPQAALAQGACDPVAVCENTRIREGQQLVWSEGVPGGSPADAAVDRWLEAWWCCGEVVDRFRERFGRALEEWAGEREEIPAERLPKHSLGEVLAYTVRHVEELEKIERPPEEGKSDPLADAIRRWLLEWIDSHPLHQFCLLREVICDLGTARPLSVRTLTAILFVIVQDCRNSLALCPCPPCGEQDGVPLARVCLETGSGEKPCRVISIDPYPPHRRPLSTDCCPARLGEVNVGCLTWHREHDACRQLADQGLVAGLRVKAVELPATFEELRCLCKQSPFVACGEEVCLRVIDGLEDLCLGAERRVIGWGPCDEELEEEPTPRPVSEERPTPHSRPEEPAPESGPQREPPAPVERVYDLTLIPGIGDSRGGALRRAGVESFAALAELSREEFSEILPSVGEKERARWIEEAKRRAETP